MFNYCPTCGNLLLVELTEFSKQLQYVCQTCPYLYSVDRKIVKHVMLTKKTVEPVMGTDDDWRKADTVDVCCPACKHTQASYVDVATKSDKGEPLTRFYRCTECFNPWNEGRVHG